MGRNWTDRDSGFVSRRYDRLADWIVFFEWLLFVPSTFRARAAQSLSLKPGDRVLEVGCGTGRNLPFLREAVGSTGVVYGVDISRGMLAKASERCARESWSNVKLFCGDAAHFFVPGPIDAILFGLSYNTMSHHVAVLRHMWSQLPPSGRLAIMDAKVPSGPLRRPALHFGIWLMERTLLGNPLIEPWTHLRSLASSMSMEEFLFGSYYICHATKVRAPSPASKVTPEYHRLDRGPQECLEPAFTAVLLEASRASSRAADVGCQEPPREVRMPRAFNSAAGCEQ